MESKNSTSSASLKSTLSQPQFWLGGFLALIVVAAASVGYWAGSQSNKSTIQLPPELLHASATHGGTNLAVATGSIDENTDGIFFLDFLTGDLQCWVFYPRTGQFGAKFATNVTAQLPAGGKNAEYLLVTGHMIQQQAGSNSRPAHSLVYVVDVRSGLFAAYGVPWNKALENSQQPQVGQLIPAGGGQYRVPTGGGAVAPANAPNPAAPANPGKK